MFGGIVGVALNSLLPIISNSKIYLFQNEHCK